MLRHRRPQQTSPLSAPNPQHFWLHPWTASTVQCAVRHATQAHMQPIVIDSDRPRKTLAAAGISTHPDPHTLIPSLLARTDRTQPVALLIGERDDLDGDALRVLRALPRLGRLFGVRLIVDIDLRSRVDILSPVVCERISGWFLPQPTLVGIPTNAVRQ